MARLGDDQRRSYPYDLTRFAEDHLDSAGIDAAGKLVRAIRRLDPGERDDAAFDLRDSLLSDDDDVVSLETVSAFGRVGQERAEVIPLLQLRDPSERDHAQLVTQPSPVTRMPAWPL